MPKTRTQKETIVSELSDAFKKAASVAFADYRGLTVSQADEMRKKFRDANVDYRVAKKSLLTLAAKQAGYDLDAKQFNGMVGAAFGLEDEIAPAKILGDTAKATEHITILGGIFEGQIVPQDKMIALSKLPSKQQLRGILVGTMYAPVSAFARVLNAIREAREASEVKLAGAPASEAKAEESASADVPAAEAAVVEAPKAGADAAEAPADSAQENAMNETPTA